MMSKVMKALSNLGIFLLFQYPAQSNFLAMRDHLTRCILSIKFKVCNLNTYSSNIQQVINNMLLNN